MTKEVMKQALEALRMPCEFWNKTQFIKVTEAIKALEEALKQEQDEPVAYVHGDDLDNMLGDRLAFIQRDKSGHRATPLYTTPQLKQEQDEPVAYVTDQYSRDGYNDEISKLLPVGTYLYTTPQQRKQEQGDPVGEAYLCDCCLTPFDGAYECPSCGHNSSTKEPVYTTPQQRKPLTDDEIWEVVKHCEDNHFAFARAIEAAHGIKE